MIQRFVPADQVQRELAELLVPPGLTFWTRRVAIEEDLLTWERMMGVMLLHLARPKAQCWTSAIVARHFKHVGQVLRAEGAVSGAELADAPPPRPLKKGYGIWHHFRDL